MKSTINSPLVSIVVNNYNNEKYLASCLNGLTSQSYKNIEIVVVDALSTDNSRELIREYSNHDKRIKTIFTETYEKFPANTYNLGFLHCSGDFIAINDPDDISMPTRIEKQINFFLKNPEVEVIGSNVIEFNDKLEREICSTVKKNIISSSSPVRNPTLMFKKMIMAKHGMWRWQSEYAADFEWLYRCYASNVIFAIIEEPLVRYRYAQGKNISNTRTIEQALKLAKFRIFFGFKLIKEINLIWWIKTLETCCYVVILILKKLFKKIFKRELN